MLKQPRVAYFSMEIALAPGVPTYAGGLGVLAGDIVRSAADLGVPMVAVSLLHRQGYFHQRLDARTGQQTEEAACWSVEEFAQPLEARSEIGIEGRKVALRAWCYRVQGVRGAEVPVLLLDSDLPENTVQDRALTGRLYGGDDRYRLAQETVLGIGGLRMLRALGFDRILHFHLNEGHAALAVLALLEERRESKDRRDPKADLEAVREQCVFTTHTPVPAGHDIFPLDLVKSVLGDGGAALLVELGQRQAVNLTDLALASSRFINGVAMRHGEVSRNMFPGYPIRSITNGIHPPTWATSSFAALFDHQIPPWRQDPLALRSAVGIPLSEIRWAHDRAKRALVERVNAETGAGFECDTLTIGFARRATAYKRATLIFRDVERLASIAAQRGAIQLVFAGKAHPRDEEGKARIREVFAMRDALRGRVSVAYLADYDMELGRLLCGGCDVWLNTPIPPLEASGTSGMKAALNGVPSLSVLDGWWLEGHVEGVTGWAIGNDEGAAGSRASALDAAHAEGLYAKLENAILPCFYGEPERFLQIRRSTIALNASFFNTQRMLVEYLYEAYFDSGTLHARR
ncbi:MAG TPA: alpha-glucan family phosphorylase [Myxococcota bacterium]|nr:alpha-glucan family phosphorylase [Myxococcota bacterium]